MLLGRKTTLLRIESAGYKLGLSHMKLFNSVIYMMEGSLLVHKELHSFKLKKNLCAD